MIAASLCRQPHVVVTGTVGVGKSTLVSNLTGCSQEIASSSAESFTKAALAYPAQGFVIIDTPGCNPLKDKLKHNLAIAGAFNMRPVRLILVCAEAHVRMDQTIDSLREFLQRLSELQGILCPLITKMDTVTWTEESLRDAVQEEYGLDAVLFSGLNKSPDELSREILAQCSGREPIDINVDSESFFRYFKVHNNDLRVLRKIKELVQRYETAVKAVQRALPDYSERERVDLVFQFQSFMLDLIPTMQQELSETGEFTFEKGPQRATELGHIANLSNQLKSVLYGIRVMALGYASQHGVSSLRKCPHCGTVWTKVEGCEGQTICGNRPVQTKRESRFTEFSSFTFSLSPHFEFRKIGSRPLATGCSSLARFGSGCGRSIVWSEMQPVPLPPDFQENQGVISTDDVSVLPNSEVIRNSWARFFRENLPTVGYAIGSQARSVMETMRGAFAKLMGE